MSALSHVIQALENGTFIKVICGAANTNVFHIERLALVYALSGADAIDVSPSTEAICAAKSGINRAIEIYSNNPDIYPHFNEPIIMASVNCGDDLHFRKIKVDYDKCVNCLECIDVCLSRAIFEQDAKIHIKLENCYGCGRCFNKCVHHAIDFVNLNNSLTQIGDNMIKGIEVHTGRSSIEELKEFLNLNQSFLSSAEVLSFSVESKRFDCKQLLDYVKSITGIAKEFRLPRRGFASPWLLTFNGITSRLCLPPPPFLILNQKSGFPGLSSQSAPRNDNIRKIIIQIDGIPMGATDEYSSSMQTISAAKILLDNNIDAYIQLAGGTNQHTKAIARQFGLKISGIGYGTFARKIILSYIDEPDESKFMQQLLKIVNITTNLAGG